MEEFYAKYGVKHKADLLERVKSDPMLAMAVLEYLLDDKFPAEVLVVAEAEPEHEQ